MDRPNRLSFVGVCWADICVEASSPRAWSVSSFSEQPAANIARDNRSNPKRLIMTGPFSKFRLSTP